MASITEAIAYAGKNKRFEEVIGSSICSRSQVEREIRHLLKELEIFGFQSLAYCPLIP